MTCSQRIGMEKMKKLKRIFIYKYIYIYIYVYIIKIDP